MTSFFNMSPELRSELEETKIQFAPVAAQFDLDLSALAGAMCYLKRIIREASPEQLNQILANQQEFVQEGMRRYNENAIKFYEQLMSDKAMFKQFATELYHDLRAAK